MPAAGAVAYLPAAAAAAAGPNMRPTPYEEKSWLPKPEEEEVGQHGGGLWQHPVSRIF